MPAPIANKNAQKPPGQAATSVLYIRVKRGDKAKWVRAANRRAQARPDLTDDRGALSGWVVDQLNQAADQ
jgi:hypothetical protein